MQTITICDVNINGTKINGLFVTPAGAMAIAQPLSMKEYVYNESRGEDGKDYLLDAIHKDDTAVAVQFAVLAANSLAAMEGLVSIFHEGKPVEIAINTGGSNAVSASFLYRSISGTTSYGQGFLLFTANLIKLAK